jgi:hypothetical protein
MQREVVRVEPLSTGHFGDERQRDLHLAASTPIPERSRQSNARPN